MVITSRTRSVDLFRLMYASEDMHPGNRTDEQQNAHIEWERRLQACESEHGSCYDRRRRYEAYCEGREDERKAHELEAANETKLSQALELGDWLTPPSND